MTSLFTFPNLPLDHFPLCQYFSLGKSNSLSFFICDLLDPTAVLDW